MILRRSIYWGLTAVLLAGGALFKFENVEAQKAPASPLPQASATPTPTPSTSEEEVIKVDTEVVNVLFTAQDRNRRLLTDLKQSDIKILENGQAQEITAFSRQVDLPLSLAILIDVSQSQERTLPEEKAAAMAFLQTVVRPTKDEVSIVSFT